MKIVIDLGCRGAPNDMYVSIKETVHVSTALDVVIYNDDMSNVTIQPFWGPLIIFYYHLLN